MNTDRPNNKPNTVQSSSDRSRLGGAQTGSDPSPLKLGERGVDEQASDRDPIEFDHVNAVRTKRFPEYFGIAPQFQAAIAAGTSTKALRRWMELRRPYSCKKAYCSHNWASHSYWPPAGNMVSILVYDSMFILLLYSDLLKRANL